MDTDEIPDVILPDEEEESLDEEEEKEEESSDESAVVESDSPVAEEKKENNDTKEEKADVQPDEGQEALVEVDGVNYTKENLSQIFSIGKQVAEYQKEHPGYDPILIHKDYTKKTQELSDLRRQAPVVSPEPVSGQKKAQEKPDISKFRKEDVEYFEQLASALGYAKGEDIEQREKQSWQRSYETVKREEIVKFLDAHPEYKPENDSQDLRWNAVKAEFD